jgi:hypothetical protein
VCTVVAVVDIPASFIVPRRAEREQVPAAASVDAWPAGNLALESEGGTP